MNVPKLRFKDDNEQDFSAWKEKSLKEITDKIGDGLHATPEYDDNGNYYFINGNNLDRKVVVSEKTRKVSKSEFLKHQVDLNSQTVLMSINGTIGNLAFYNDEKIILGKSVCYLNLKKDQNRTFLFNALQTKKIISFFEKELTGSTIRNLSLTTIKSAKIYVPSLEEQTKIANFLSAVDDKIAELTKKIELLQRYKKGAMQQIFSQQLRFKDDNGQDFPEWDIRDLETISSKVTLKNRDFSVSHVLTNSATQGIVSQSEYFDRDIANKINLDGYYVVELDDFVYNPRISIHALVGPIKRNKLMKGVMSPLYTVFRFKEGDLSFFEQYFETMHWHEYMKNVSNTGVRHDRMNITNENFFSLPIPYPSLPEQTKIANFLSALDEQINISQQQLESSKQYKKSLLQQMFI